MYVKRIESNVKSADGLVWSADLGPKTIIVGPNGRGKSRIVNAVELALTGRASDLAGRADVAREADLLALAPGRSADLYAHAILDTEETATFRVVHAGAGKAKKADHEVPSWFAREELLPVRAVRDAMLGSPDTACRVFLQWAASGNPLDIDGMLSPSLLPELNRLRALHPNAGLDVLEQAARKRKLEANASIKALDAAARNATVSGALPTHEEVAEAQARVARARGVLVRAQAQSQAAQQQNRLAQLAQTASEAEAEAATLRPSLEAWKAHAAALPPTAANVGVAQKLVALLDFAAESGDGDCLMCGEPVTLASLTALRNQINLAIGADMTAAGAHATAHQNVADLTRRLHERETQATYARSALAAASSGTPDEAPIDAASAIAEATAADEALRALTSATAAWGAARSVMAQADAARTEAATFKSLEEALVQVGRLALTSALASYGARVQALLPPTDAFSMVLNEGAREVFHAGLLRDDVLHTALSGAEWARVTMAMSVGILAPTSRLAVIVPEERAFDPKTLAAVMVALADAKQQVIITSPVAPAGRLPKGWTLVDLS